MRHEIARMASLPAVRSAMEWFRDEEAEFARWQMDLARIPAPPFGEEARAEWRQAALASLKKAPELVKDPALAGLRDAAAMEALPAEEREAWKAVWDGR